MKTDLRSFINKYWILILLILIKMILQYIVVNPVYELHRDEFLYLNQSDHLAFGYISVPPLTALLSKLVFLTGGGQFWVRFYPALFGSLTIVFVWLIIEAVNGSLLAKILASSALIFSALMRINILFQPNSFDVLVWTIVFYLLIRFMQSEKDKWIYLLSFTIAAGFYNKYTVIFLLAGLLAGFILTDKRRILAAFPFWKAVILCLIILAPNIIWQVTNHFPVFEHMKVLKANQLDNITPMDFLKNQVKFFIGSLPLTLAAIAAFVIYKPFREYRFILITFITIMALFALLRAKDYYAVGIFPVMIAFGSIYIDQVLSGKWRIVIIPLLISLNLLIFFSLFKLIFPVYSPAEIRIRAQKFEQFGLLRWEDGKNHNLPQDFADMLGWREMASKALAAYRDLPENELKNTLIICSNYGQAGALNYYNRRKMPEAYAFNTDYIYWLPRLKTITNVVFVGRKPGDDITRAFRELKPMGVVENEEAREKGTGIYLLLGSNEAFTGAFYKLVEERKLKLDIF
jgi:hypothetical protein